MTTTALDVIRGAAVVIDDRIGQESDIDDLLKQLSDSSVPTVKLRKLPPLESLPHWRQFSLIVMDWALTDVEDDEPEITMPPGVPAPTVLAESIVDRNVRFLAALIEQTAMPVFIATNEPLDNVNAALRKAFGESYPLYGERLHVFSKSELTPNLFETIDAWLSSRPALRVLDAWRKSYIDAEIDVFHQFSRAQRDWVASVQRAAKADDADIRVTLRDLIGSNVLNRIGPLDVRLEAVADDGLLDDAASLRRVLHYSTVVPDSSLAESEVSTGDMFVSDGSVEPFPVITILLTPECDLTLRDEKWRFTTLTATRSAREAKASKNRAQAAWKWSKSREMYLTVNLLTEDCVEYDIAVNEWSSEIVTPQVADGAFVIWPGHRRIGRLLPPYSTFLQQSFAHVAIRKGMPRLPADLYEGVSALLQVVGDS